MGRLRGVGISGRASERWIIGVGIRGLAMEGRERGGPISVSIGGLAMNGGERGGL